VAQGYLHPPDPEARYHGKPIPQEYAVVYLGLMSDEFDSDELDFAPEEGYTTIAGARVLWNKADIVLEEKKPASKSSGPPSSPPGGPSDDDDGNGGDDNGGDGPSSSPGCSPPSDMSNQQGGTGGAPGN